MNGQKERLMVLDMLAEGKITAEEAELLFKAMEEAGDKPDSDSPELVPPLSHLSHLASLPTPPDHPIHPFLKNASRSDELVAALKETGISWLPAH